MKVLILTCSTGGGHNSAAAALVKALEERGVQTTVRNALDFRSRLQRWFVPWGHNFCYRHLPYVFGLVYEYLDYHPSRATYNNYSNHNEALQEYLTESGFDAILCVHPFAAMMMTGLRRDYGFSVPVFFLATDYTCSPSVEQLDVTAWLVPKGLKHTFANHGIPSDRIIETGIPVAEDCYHPLPKEEAREKLRIHPEGKLVLLTCGSMGAGNLKLLAAQVIHALPKGTELVVMTGNNRKLYRSLTGVRAIKGVKPLAFTNQAGLWMDAADLILTKPGGLTSTEAVTRHRPVIFFDNIPGLETHNLRYFMARGCAEATEVKMRIPRMAARLLTDPDTIETIHTQQEMYFHENSTEKVVDTILRVVQER